MATNERRTGVSRRGMTILGKVPVAPKPINLPSQRSTFCWGNAGRIFPTRVHSGKDESAPLKLESNGEKIESKASGSSGTTDCGDGVNLQKKKAEPLPASIKENSAAASTAAMTSSNNAVKVEEPSTCHACDSASLKQESTNPKAQRSGGGFSGGVAAPPGFSHTSSHSNGRTGLVSMDSHCGCPGNGTHAYPLQQSGSHCTPGVPYRTGPKDREIIVIHMVGGPGFYSNYTQFGLPEAYNRNGGSYGSVPLQFGSFEPVFNVPGHGRTDYGPRFASDRGTGYLNEREGYICYEKECYLGGCHGRHRNSQVHRTAGNSFVGNAYGGAYDPMMRVRTGSISHNVLTTKPTRSRSLYCNGISIPSYMEESSAEPVSERPVTLLTKSLQHDPKAQSFSAGDGKNVFYPDSTYLNMELYGDEGKPPLEEFEGARIVEHVQMKATSSSVDSTTSEKKDEAIVLKETSLNKSQVLLSKGICNEKCLHCKDNSTSKISPSLCEACDREHVQMKATSSSVDSTTWEKKDEQIVLKETSLNKSQVSLSKVTCNEKCLHCKDNSTSTISPSLCEVCDREHVQMKASSSSVDSTTWEKKDEAIVLKETSLNKSQVSLSKGTCNEKCLHCKDNSTGRISPSVCEECDREHVQMKATLSPVDSTTREKKDGTIVIKEISSDKSQVSLSKVTCNEKCLHCKDISTSRISPSLCEASDRDNGYETSTTQSNQCFGHTEKDPMTSFGKDAMDGCKTEEKHIIFDADNTKTDTMKSEAFGKEAEVPQRSQILVSDSGDVHATKTNIKIQSDASLKKNAGRNQKFYLKKKLQYKSMVKPGNQVSKAHGVPQKQSSQNLAASFSVKKDPKGIKFYQKNAVHSTMFSQCYELSQPKSKSTSSSHNEHPENLMIDQNLPLETVPRKYAYRQQKPFYRQTETEELFGKLQTNGNSSEISQLVKPLYVQSQGDVVTNHEQEGEKLTVPVSDYHIIRRRVYHVVEGSEGDSHVFSSSVCTKDKNLQFSNKQLIQKSEGNTLPTSAIPFSRCEGRPLSAQSLQLEMECCDDIVSDNPYAVVSSLHSQKFSGACSRQEDDMKRKYAKVGRKNSVWKPKSAIPSTVLGIVSLEKDQKDDTSVSLFVVQNSDTDSCEKHSSMILNDLSTEGKLLSSGVCESEVDNQIMRGQKSPSVREEHAERPIDSATSVEDVGSESVLNHQQITSMNSSKLIIHHGARPLEPNKENQVSGQEKSCASWRPFIQKNRMSREKADRYHQFLFKRYKEVGQWIPRFESLKKSSR